jgi:hypothetical protein
MDIHWADANKLRQCLNRIKKGTKVQTYFNFRQPFFTVNHHLNGGPQPLAFDLYQERFGGEVESARDRQILPPKSENKITPLLKVMLWHEHLDPFLLDDQSSSDSSTTSDNNIAWCMYSCEKVRLLISVIALPKGLQKRIALRHVTFAYLSKIKHEFKACNPRLKCMLIEYPSS